MPTSSTTMPDLCCVRCKDVKGGTSLSLLRLSISTSRITTHGCIANIQPHRYRENFPTMAKIYASPILFYIILYHIDIFYCIYNFCSHSSLLKWRFPVNFNLYHICCHLLIVLYSIQHTDAKVNLES